ncbi:hypothetical protein AAFF_G00074490 [Aldrovandia affinis]|uniref:Uncharacterized protein n=1 Tax=Aldrovandia affinis TaxID=143900 RepID=A0AAD7S0V3_9TELE|nr:hypothetical protein AAFF_G00074490 [Aldrovandia affinis]
MDTRRAERTIHNEQNKTLHSSGRGKHAQLAAEQFPLPPVPLCVSHPRKARSRDCAKASHSAVKVSRLRTMATVASFVCRAWRVRHSAVMSQCSTVGELHSGDGGSACSVDTAVRSDPMCAPFDSAGK